MLRKYIHAIVHVSNDSVDITLIALHIWIRSLVIDHDILASKNRFFINIHEPTWRSVPSIELVLTIHGHADDY